MKQRTISQEGRLKGIGIHSGERAELCFRPAPVNHGLYIIKRGAAPGENILHVDLSTIDPHASMRRTVLRHPSGWTVETPEHFLASCLALGLTNLEVELDGRELPFLDGSAAPFAEALRAANPVDQEGPPPPCWTVEKPVFFRVGDSEFAVLPSENQLTVSCFIDFPGTVIGTQAIAYVVDSDIFAREIAPARTFVLEADIEALRKRGLIRGGTPDLAVVAGREAYLNPPLRFPDECVRHKVIDFLGDLALVGGLPRGHFMVVRAGHAPHLAFNHHLRKESLLRWIHPPFTPHP